MYCPRVVCLALVTLMACDGEPAEPAADGGEASTAAERDASAPQCPRDDRPQYVGIATAPLDDSQLRFTSELELSGPGVDEVFDAKQNGLLTLSWEHDRWIVLAFGGFWEIEPGKRPNWVDTSRIMHDVLTADVDDDGDFDALVVSSGTETIEVDGAPATQFTTRVEVWERTRSGLGRSTELWSKIPGGIVGTSFAFVELDGDGTLDIISFSDRELVGYYGDGAFGFSRKVLADSQVPGPEYGAIALRVEDRNDDDREDIYAVMGAGGIGVEFHNLVYLRAADGGFLPHAPPVPFELSPSPLAAGDVTGDGLSDVVAQGFREGEPVLRLTASTGSTTFAPTTTLEPASQGVRVADVDQDGTLDVLTEIDSQLVAQLGRGGTFERRDLISVANALDLAVRPEAGRRPASLGILYSTSCDPHCEEDCLARCLDGGCVVCTSDSDCESGTCQGGSCASRAPRML